MIGEAGRSGCSPGDQNRTRKGAVAGGGGAMRALDIDLHGVVIGGAGPRSGAGAGHP
jgi:hypothetical protein